MTLGTFIGVLPLRLPGCCTIDPIFIPLFVRIAMDPATVRTLLRMCLAQLCITVVDAAGTGAALRRVPYVAASHLCHVAMETRPPASLGFLKSPSRTRAGGAALSS